MVVSLALNLVGFALFWHFFTPPPERNERRSLAEIVTIQKRRPPAPVVVPPRVVRVPPVPHVHVRPRPVVAAAAAPQARAPHITPHRPPPRNVPHPAELAK
ncbi:MAG: hypothetical protein IAI49_11160, partial [Candidatus Eremiobacteraeota bacterium]|nr:hypothetical protein [Candidatus Eremiobacteraeota bacterium]